MTFSLQIMTLTRSRPDQQRYFVSLPEAEAWGVTVTAGGRQTSAPGAVYPPSGHPADHMFRWETGRVLGATQIVFITAGRGFFDSRETGLVGIKAGTALVILPGTWHRYAPDPATGWAEQWIELRGGTLTRLIKRGVLDMRRAVIPVERILDVERLMDMVLARLAPETADAVDPERAALGLQILAILTATPRAGLGVRALTPVIARAERRLAESVDQPPNMAALAREMGVAYSYFRREFKRHTGLSPYQYLQQLRLEKARRLIGGATETLEVIAERLGFASACHLSAAFKKQYGQAPSHWRRGR